MLVLVAPAVLFGEIADWCFSAAAAAVGIAMLLTASRASLSRTWVGFRAAAPMAAILTAIPVLQLAPWAPSLLTSPIWNQASQALRVDLGRSISLVPGATLSSLASLIALIALATATTLVAGDRRDAFWLLRAAGLTILIMLALLMAGGWLSLIESDHRPILSLLGSLGVVVATALGVAAFGRRASTDTPGSSRPITLALAALLAAAGVLAQLSQPGVVGLIATAAGIILCLLAARLPLPRIGGRVVLAITTATTLLAIALAFGTGRDAGAALTSMATARQDRAMTAQDAQRMLADTPPLGTGAGTLDFIAAAYGSRAGHRPPSAAIEAYVEFGAVGGMALLAAGLFLALKLLAGAARRGRDRHYPACAAAVIALIMIRSFSDPGLTGAAPQIVVAVLVGIGLAQRRSAES
ncbi:hypothetical protein [Bradyrhizobium sp. ORS 375]|uniref:hypothetical protein n=1 Tax=Bradyrhizobium sp. (strain ORS 375) TaxID=566679 RepID=UPI0003150EFB|nr:hypothetical protein [Bradyrhizobium sp. ORS 375]